MNIVTVEDLLAYEWVLAPPSVGTRQWLDQVFRHHGLPPPHVQIETNLILMMPTLIRETELLTFTSRLHVGPGDAGADLRLDLSAALALGLGASYRDYLGAGSGLAARFHVRR